jgi:hypothetical protein
MTARPDFARFLRLLDVIFPKSGHLMALYEGYFDESGDFEEEPKIFCVSGYYLESEQAKAMTAEWKQLLETHGIPYFHMVDCAHGNPPFKGKNCVEIATQCIALIKKYTLYGFSVVSKAEYFTASDRRPDEYAMCVDACIGALRGFLDTNRLDGEIAYFFESGHKSAGMVYNMFARRVEADGASITFESKLKVPLLQAGDLLAWQTRKNTQDTMRNIRPPRKDFLALMEHPHSLVYVSVVDGELQLVVSDWPMSRRSQNTVVLNPHNDEFLPYFTEDDDPTPIILVNKALGWRSGAGKMIYLGLESGPKPKNFALAFDEKRLSEFREEVMLAGSFSGGWSNRGFFFDVTKTWTEDGGGSPVICVSDGQGTRINLRLTPQALETLKKNLLS